MSKFVNTTNKNIILIKSDGTYEATDHVTKIGVSLKTKKISIDCVPITLEKIVGYSGIDRDSTDNYIVDDTVFQLLRTDKRFNKRIFKIDQFDECADTLYVHSLVGVNVC